MAGQDLMIYGANGYTGSLIAERACERGLRPVLAGRREDAVRPLAERLGLPFRVFGLDAANADANFENIGTLLLAAGPFSATSAPAIEACLRTGTHYLDITGEIAVFEAAQRRDGAAKAAGITLLPGAGYDVVPSDCLAKALHDALPGATTLQLAIAMIGAPGPGSIKTAVEGAAEGGWVRRGGELKKVPGAWRSAKIPFAHGERWAMTIPWGDVSTAYWSTKIPDIEVYMATPRPAILATRLSRPFMRLLQREGLQNTVKRAIEVAVTGGDKATREAGRSWVWGRVADAAGRAVEGNVDTLETTLLTTHTAVEIAQRLQRGEVAPGYTTPSLAFGADFIRRFPQTHMTIG